MPTFGLRTLLINAFRFWGTLKNQGFYLAINTGIFVCVAQRLYRFTDFTKPMNQYLTRQERRDKHKYKGTKMQEKTFLSGRLFLCAL